MKLRRVTALAFSVWIALSSSVMAYAETVKVNLRDTRPIDIILAAGDTAYDLDQFEPKLRASLASAGVDMDRVKIQSVEGTSSDKDDNFPWVKWGNTSKVGVGPSTFDFGTSFDRPYPIQLVKNEIIVDGDYSQGYSAGVEYKIPQNGMTVSKFALEFTLDPSKMLSHPSCSAYFEVCGFMFNIVKGSYGWSTNVTYPGQVSTNLGDLTGPTHFRLEVTKNTAKLLKDGNKIFDRKQEGIALTGMKLSVTYGGHGCDAHAYFKLSDVILETQIAKDLVDVVRAPDWRPDSHRFVFDVNDVARKDFNSEGSLGELVQRLSNDGAYYIGYGLPGPGNSFNQMDLFINKMGASTESNNLKKGKTFLNTSDAGSAHASMDAAAKYIEYIVNKVTSGKDQVVVPVGRSFQYEVDPASLAKNTATAAAPAGKWQTNYSTTYSASMSVPGVGSAADSNYKFEGALEPPFWTNTKRDAFNFSTSQVGSYRITFDGVPVTPAQIVVHQLPVAQFGSFSCTRSANQYVIQFTTSSYDPDAPNHILNGRGDRGIAKHVVSYRPAGINGSSAWVPLTGLIPTVNSDGTLNFVANLSQGPSFGGPNYELMYQVYDYQGASSMPVIKYISGNTDTKIKPIAAFDFTTSKYSTYEWEKLLRIPGLDLNTVIQDTSYDPMGGAGTILKLWTWQWTDVDGKNIGRPINANPKTEQAALIQYLKSISTYPSGMYYLQLVVTRNGTGETVSEPYKRVIQFTREAYALWFSDLWDWKTTISDNGDKLPSGPAKLMKGYNATLGFEAAYIPSDSSTADRAKYSRRVTFNSLRAENGIRVNNKQYAIQDKGYITTTPRNVSYTKYPLQLNKEFVWPVSTSQTNSGEALIALGGTPYIDWALVPDGIASGVPAYFATDKTRSNGMGSFWWINKQLTWNATLNEYVLLSVTAQEGYEFQSKVPGNANMAWKVYSPTLDRQVYDWETDKFTDFQDIYEFPHSTNGSTRIKVPSQMASIDLTGWGGYTWNSSGARSEQRVSAVYFRDRNIQDASAGGKLGYKSRQNQSGTISVATPDKGAVKYMYFYVSPETSLVTGETYTNKGLGTATYADDVFATSINTIEIYRMRDNIRMKLDDSLLTSTQTSIQKNGNQNASGTQKPITVNLAMEDTSAIIRGYRINGSKNWTTVKQSNTAFSFVPTQKNNTVEVLVSPEDREIQQIYTITYVVPNTFQATDAKVVYKTLSQGTFTGVQTNNNTFVITVPENVREGKLSISALNSETLISNINKQTYKANAVEIDHSLPLHRNPNATFTLTPVVGGAKNYVIEFQKTSTPPTVTLLNRDKLAGIFSPQGRWLNNQYLAYEHIADAGPAYSGNGIPIELEIGNKDTVQGVTAEVVFNGESFPVHWDSFDGPTYRDGSAKMRGFAVISKSAISGLNDSQGLACTVYTYDYEGSAYVDKATVTLPSINTDSTGPSFAVSNTLNPSQMRFTSISDNLTRAKELTIEWASQTQSGYDNIYNLDVEGKSDVQVRVDGVTGMLKCKFTMYDVLRNPRIVEIAEMDFSDVKGIDVHMEYGRDADGYFINVRKDDNESIGADRFDFIEP